MAPKVFLLHYWSILMDMGACDLPKSRFWDLDNLAHQITGELQRGNRSHGAEGYKTDVTAGIGSLARWEDSIGSIWTVFMHKTRGHVLDFFVLSWAQFANEPYCKVTEFPISGFSTWPRHLGVPIPSYGDGLRSWCPRRSVSRLNVADFNIDLITIVIPQ